MTAKRALTEDNLKRLVADLQGYLRQQQQNPLDPFPPYHCGLIYSQLGDSDAAIRSYQEAVQRNPEFSQAYYNMALTYQSQQLYKEAEHAYKQAIVHTPGDSEPWANLGALQEFLKRPEDALESYRRALDNDPDDREVRRRLGALLMSQDHMIEAKELYQAGIEHNPEDSESWNGLGLVAFHREEFDSALEHYLSAVDVDPHHAGVWNNLGNLYLRTENEAKAVESYRRALAADPNDPTIWFNLGEFFFSRDHPEAEKCLNRVVELDADDLETWGLLRQWYNKHPNLVHWKSVLGVLLKAKPDDTNLMRELALVQERLGENESALHTLQDVVALAPEHPASRLQIASLALKLNSLQEAFQHLTMIDSDEPDILDLWYLLGQRLLYHNHPEEAETAFLKLVAHRNWQADAWQFLGQAAYDRGQWDLALERWKRADELNRNDEGVWMSLADQFIQLGNYEKAVECLDQLSEHLRFQPGKWKQFATTYQRAGKIEAFLDGLEQVQWEHQLGDEQWIALAELFQLAGLPERAEACLGRQGQHKISTSPSKLRDVDARSGKPPAPRISETPPTPGEVRTPQELKEKGKKLYSNGSYRQSLAYFQQSLDLDQTDFESWFQVGNVQSRLNRPDLAEEAFLGALEQEPSNPKALYNLGCVLEAQDKFKEAAKRFEQAVEQDPNFSEAWNWLGVVHFRMGDEDEARQAYVRSLAHNRGSVKAWHNLGMLYLRMGDKEKSEYCMSEVEKLGGISGSSNLIPGAVDVPDPTKESSGIENIEATPEETF